MLRKLLTYVTVLCFYLSVAGQTKKIPAIKVTHAPVIDADLNDEVWQQAPNATDFLQFFPSYGIASTTKTSVKILYDNDAIYVGAYLYDDRANIRTQITSRDAEQLQDVDYFSVFLDTYNDQQNGFQFLVTTQNVQTDAKLTGNSSPGFGQFGDRTWDAVWYSKTKVTNNGWIVEMMIPYSSLRFSKKDIQTWGLQFLRFTRKNNETSFWNPVNPNINGFVNQFGKYENLQNIQPPLRLSFSPYISTGVRINPDPATVKSSWLKSGGMDVKYGINESFTLDATLIPDFGQVISDNIINNLSPYEVKFQENRPFFTEGTELFNKSGLFYSRRIGDIPSGYDSIQSFAINHPGYEIISNPSVTQLINGIKFSGRTQKKLGIGIFNALTAPMMATIRDSYSKKDSLIETEPLTNYNIIVLDQALKGQSSLTFTNTNVIREGNYRNANVSAFDWSLYTSENKYQFAGTARYSKIFGYTLYNGNINLINDTVTRLGNLYLNPYNGFNTSVKLGRVSGPVQYYISNNIISHTYDPNDLGYQQVSNLLYYNAGISYHQFTPTTHFISYQYNLDLAYRYLYKPNSFREAEIDASVFLLFKNFWDITFALNTLPVMQNDYFDLRTPGRYVKKPSEIYFNANGSTDSRKKLWISYFVGYAVRPQDEQNPYYRTDFGIRYRFSKKLTISYNIYRQDEKNQVGYAFLRETTGDPIIGYRRNLETISIVNGTYNFTPQLYLSVRVRHYWNMVHYNSFYNVDYNGNAIPRAFIPDQDQNYNVFNLDAFFTWDFRPGSRMIVGWKNWLGNSYGIDGIKYNNYTDNLGQTLAISHGNEFTMRFIYYLDYNRFKRR